MKNIQAPLTNMKSPLTTSLRKQTPVNKKAIPYMTSKKSNFTYMKKIAIIIFLITSFQNFGQAIANQPTNYMVCDTQNNGVENISLSLKDSEILGSQSSADFSVTYFNTLIDAQVNANPIGNNYAATNETVYAKVTENNNTSNFDITSFQIMLSQMVIPIFSTPTPVCQGTSFTLPNTSTNGIIGSWNTNISNDTPPGNYTITFTPDSGQCSEIATMNITVNPKPIANYAPAIVMTDTPYDGVATFNLAQNQNIIVGGQTGVITTFYPSLSDAVLNSNPISNPNLYNNLSNPQTIGVRVTNPATGCYSVTTFNIAVTNPNPNIINFTDSAFKSKLLAANPGSPTAYSNGNMVKIDTNDDLEIQYSEAVVIDSLDVSFSNIIDMTGIEAFTNLKNLNCNNNQISTLNLTSNNILEKLFCHDNELVQLNVSNLINLEILICYANILTNLDVSNLSNLSYLDCVENPITYLNIKNGFIQNSPNFINFINPSLQYICVDDGEVYYILQSLMPVGISCTVNSYCSFTPGGTYNTLTGTATFDINNNGCDASDIPFGSLGLNVSLNGVSNNSSVFTNNAGVYNLYTNVGGVYQLNPNLENPTYYNVSPVVQAFPVIDNSSVTQNFCITANGVHPDLEIVIAPITPARPGFDAQYQIVYKNKGNQTLTGSFNFNYDDAKLDFVTSTIVPSSSTTGILTWNYTNLLPFENRTVYVTLNVNSPVEIPAVNIGDVFTFSSTINPIISDETPSDNTFTYAQSVVGSYDPNDITCMEGESISPSEIGEYLHYIVNFENTGNYYAENVVVKIEIDETKYDINSLQLLNTSHENKSKITNNIVEFMFEGINLAAASGNPPVGGHGNVLFKIKSKDNLVTGDMVQKAAKIYFDYNAPIETNISQTIYQSLNNSIFEFDQSVKVYPNPTNSIVNINSDFNIKSVELYDVQGRLLEKSFEDNSSTILNLSERQNGIYFVKITSDKGSKVEKVVKN